MEITINGVPIQFPFKPYQVQEDYMKKIIECLQDGKNGVLESPTGTGKTLSLLCSTLAWLMIKKAQLQSIGSSDECSKNVEISNLFAKSIHRAAGKVLTDSKSFEDSKPQIIYASRTHSQLTQAIQELKKTSYKHVNAIILGSRDQLCIHPKVSQEQNSSNKIHMCQARIKSRTCNFYNNFKDNKSSIDKNILDIEDLVNTCKKSQLCPYFLSRSLKDYADIIFMPYNYLLDPKLKKNQGIALKNKIVLLDEAHNIEKICEEAASLQLSSTDVAVCINEITDVMRKMSETIDQVDDPSFNQSNNKEMDFSPEDLCTFKAMFLELEKAIDNIEMKNRDEGETFFGDYIFDLLKKAKITNNSECSLVIQKLDKIISYLTIVSNSNDRKGRALQKFCDLLQIVFFGGSDYNFKEKIKKYFKVHIQIEQPKKSFKNDAWEIKKVTKSNGKLINFWCFSPGFRMQQILDDGVRSIILTSGTLSPLKPFISEIGIDIDVQLENAHIVSEKQICVGIISTGCDGYCLNSSYNTRNDPKYIASLGDTIKALSGIVPHGLLIFFPSYPILKNCQEQWQNSGKWTQIQNYKSIYVEPQSKNILNNIINEYYKKIQDPTQRGAILMGVCRGKISEGLDFADANGRAVLITGLPFPPLKDPRVILKQRYLEENRFAGKERLTGQQWYQLEASRAVNQAIGRIIRHKNDYGTILLCDCRFDNQMFKQQLSAWIRPHIKKFKDFQMVTKELNEFFKNKNLNLYQSMMNSTVSNDMILTPVPAQFDYRSNRSSKSSFELKFGNEEDNFDIDSYKIEPNSSEKETKETNVNDFTSLLNAKSKTVVNLSTCKLQNVSKVFQEPLTLEEPTIKRRKLKIKPIQFNIDPIASTSTSNPTSTTCQSKSIQMKKGLTARQDSGYKYIQEVKSSLSKDNYNIFKNASAKYSKAEISLDELLTTLKKLFMVNQKQKHLFIDYRTYLKGNDLKSFDNYVELMENSNI